MRRLLAALALAAPLSAAAAETGERVSFIACPIYRDTDAGKKSGCWLADDLASGLRYDVSPSPYKPDWNYAVLVEGQLAHSGSSPVANPCGGIVLDPVRTSRLYDQPCTRHMLPAEGFAGRRFVLPPRNIAPSSAPRPVPPPPYSDRVFSLYFEYGNDFLTYQYSDFLLDQAISWVLAAKPKRLIVTGFAAILPLEVSGQTLREAPGLAAQRAQTIATSLQRMLAQDLPSLTIETATDTSGSTTPDKDADGLPDQSRRRVEIRALF